MRKIEIIYLIFIASNLIFSQRIKDIAYITGDNPEQVIGYGLVVGLSGTGDSQRSSFTVQSVTSMLKKFGITVPDADLRIRNAAAVIVTTVINSYLKTGAKFDVTVSSLGDATSLQGGTLLMTPLSNIAGDVFGFAQGSISVGGFDIKTPTGNRVAKNHSLAGRVPLGGIIKNPIVPAPVSGTEISVFLRDPDITTAFNIAKAINQKFGENTGTVSDPSEIKVKIPAGNGSNLYSFLSELESLSVEVDYTAKVVLNERTGTIVAGSNVKIKPVTISHGSLNISIRSYPIISQPGAFSNGNTAVFNNLVPYVNQDTTNAIAIEGASTVQEVAAALNSLKVTPKDIISIFQALKEAGALVAELVII